MFQLHGLDSDGFMRQCGVVAYWSRRDAYRRPNLVRWVVGVVLAGLVFFMTRF
jgi:hypothetical protein